MSEAHMLQGARKLAQEVSARGGLAKDRAEFTRGQREAQAGMPPNPPADSDAAFAYRCGYIGGMTTRLRFEPRRKS